MCTELAFQNDDFALFKTINLSSAQKGRREKQTEIRNRFFPARLFPHLDRSLGEFQWHLNAQSRDGGGDACAERSVILIKK